MSVINAPSLLNTAYTGEAALATAHGYATLASAAIGHKVRFTKLYAGTKVVDLKFVFADLGTGTTMSIGFEYVDGQAGGSATAFLPATDVATAAGSARSAAAPVTLEFDAFIIGTIGGGTATGRVDVVTVYESK